MAQSKGTRKKAEIVATESRKKNPDFPEPLTAALDEFKIVKGSHGSPSMGTRSNTAATITRTRRFANIEEGATPFIYGSGWGRYSSNISIRDTIVLCQKAYWNVSIFKNTIDLMTEFACSPIYFAGGNKESRDFFNNWAKKINLWRLVDMFFREYFRSGNVFIYKLFGTFDRAQMKKLQDMKIAEGAQKIPLRYLILNPADIEIIAASNFTSPIYIKVLNSFEIKSLLSDNASAEDQQIRDSIPELKQLKENSKKGLLTVSIPLSPDRLCFVFYKKQDYEPMSIPMGYAVLEDINWKIEMKKIDMAISRTIQQAVLLVTAGDKDVGAPTKEHMKYLRTIFENESVGRVLISDYTTDVKFVIPNIGEILDPQKYEVVDRDIRFGLNNILFGEDKFSNASTKMDAFFKRLIHAREEFMNNFLRPEIENIGRAMNFKSIPAPRWEEENFKDNSAVLSRVYVRMLELGAISPQDAITAITENRLPTAEELDESQKTYLAQKDQGYFVPLLNQGKDGGGSQGQTGRPVGTGSPKSSTTTSPIGKKAVAGFGITKIKATLEDKDRLLDRICSRLKVKYKVTKLKEEQQMIAKEITNLIVASEKKEDWNAKVRSYIANPSQNTLQNDVTKEIFEIAEEHGVDEETASILFHSKM